MHKKGYLKRAYIRRRKCQNCGMNLKKNSPEKCPMCKCTLLIPLELFNPYKILDLLPQKREIYHVQSGKICGKCHGVISDDNVCKKCGLKYNHLGTTEIS